MFENIPPSGLFVSERSGTRRLEKLDNEELHDLYFSYNIVSAFMT
jgi:hypothetical protein